MADRPSKIDLDGAAKRQTRVSQFHQRRKPRKLSTLRRLDRTSTGGTGGHTLSSRFSAAVPDLAGAQETRLNRGNIRAFWRSAKEAYWANKSETSPVLEFDETHERGNDDDCCKNEIHTQVTDFDAGASLKTSFAAVRRGCAEVIKKEAMCSFFASHAKDSKATREKAQSQWKDARAVMSKVKVVDRMKSKPRMSAKTQLQVLIAEAFRVDPSLTRQIMAALSSAGNACAQAIDKLELLKGNAAKSLRLLEEIQANINQVGPFCDFSSWITPVALMKYVAPPPTKHNLVVSATTAAAEEDIPRVPKTDSFKNAIATFKSQKSLGNVVKAMKPENPSDKEIQRVKLEKSVEKNVLPQVGMEKSGVKVWNPAGTTDMTLNRKVFNIKKKMNTLRLFQAKRTDAGALIVDSRSCLDETADGGNVALGQLDHDEPRSSETKKRRKKNKRAQKRKARCKKHKREKQAPVVITMTLDWSPVEAVDEAAGRSAWMDENNFGTWREPDEDTTENLLTKQFWDKVEGLAKRDGEHRASHGGLSKPTEVAGIETVLVDRHGKHEMMEPAQALMQQRWIPSSSPKGACPRHRFSPFDPRTSLSIRSPETAQTGRCLDAQLQVASPLSLNIGEAVLNQGSPRRKNCLPALRQASDYHPPPLREKSLHT